MAVTEVVEKRHVGGDFGQERFSVEVEYQATTDNKDDGPDVVRRHPIFRLGRGYTFGNDRNPSATLKNVSPVLLSDGGRTTWIVRCTFETTEPGESGEPGQDDINRGSDSSEDEPPFTDLIEMDPPRLSIGFITKSEPMLRAKYLWVETYDFNGFRQLEYLDNLGGPGGGPYVGPVCNSVSIPKVPQPERELQYPVFKMEGYLRLGLIEFYEEELLNAKGKLNRGIYTLKSPKTKLGSSFEKVCGARTLRVENIQIGDIIQGNETNQVKVSYEFAFNDKQWLHREFDESIAIRPDPDTFNDRVAAGLNPELEIMRDERGTALPNPVPLDGKGEINRTLVTKGGKASASTTPISYFLTFLPDEDDEIDFSKLPKLW